MKREDVLAIIPGATEEQISAFLNQHNQEKQELITQNGTLTAEKQALELQKQALEAQNKPSEGNVPPAQTQGQNQQLNTTDELVLSMQREMEQMKKDMKIKDVSLEVRKIYLAAGLEETVIDELVKTGISDDLESSKAFASTIAAIKSGATQQQQQQQQQNTPLPGGSGSTETKSAVDSLIADYKSAADSNSEGMKNFI